MRNASRIPARFCSVCGLLQRNTPSGLVCENGHGGADSIVEPSKKTILSVRQKARRLANHAILTYAHSEDVLVRAALASIADRVLRGKPKPGQCCQWEDRDAGGDCRNCGTPL